MRAAVREKPVPRVSGEGPQPRLPALPAPVAAALPPPVFRCGSGTQAAPRQAEGKHWGRKRTRRWALPASAQLLGRAELPEPSGLLAGVLSESEDPEDSRRKRLLPQLYVLRRKHRGQGVASASVETCARPAFHSARFPPARAQFLNLNLFLPGFSYVPVGKLISLKNALFFLTTLGLLCVFNAICDIMCIFLVCVSDFP